MGKFTVDVLAEIEERFGDLPLYVQINSIRLSTKLFKDLRNDLGMDIDCSSFVLSSGSYEIICDKTLAYHMATVELSGYVSSEIDSLIVRRGVK